MFSGGAISDPFRFDRPGAYPGSSSASGRAARASPGLVAGEATAVFVAAGQSSIAASENSNYTSTNTAKVDNLNVYDGGMYAAQDPLLGCGLWSAGGCWLSRLADKLIDAGTYQRVILVPLAVGSTSVDMWWSEAGFRSKLLAAARRCDALALPITAWLWAQGEDDVILGTSSADYEARLREVINVPRSIDHNEPWLIGKVSWNGTTTNAGLRAAQSNVVNGTDILAGADMDTVTGPTYRYDGIHQNATGANAMAELWKTAIQSEL